MDYVMEKTSELGLHRILPFSSERTVVRLNEERFANKKQHWHELARSAAKQSDRKTPMEIGPLSSFEELVESCRAEDALKVILWEEETATDLKGVLRRSPPFTPSPPASPEAKPMADGRDRWRAGQTLPPEGEGKACPVLDTGVGVMKFIGVVGPEGGFSEQEVRAAEKAGFVSVSLGQRVLRAETAAVAIVAIVQYEWGDLSLRHPPKPGA
jgi:16S rRNA (uracil1498-N3)-methyltransferase